MAFGGYHGANILLYRLYDSLPYLVLGRTLSLHAVALYSRGIAICQVPDKVLLGGVASVVLTSYSAEVRNGGDLRTSYLRAIEMITALQWPGLVLNRHTRASYRYAIARSAMGRGCATGPDYGIGVVVHVLGGAQLSDACCIWSDARCLLA